MSHRCGANCRRKQTPSQRNNCPSCGSRRLPKTITAGGRTFTVTDHVRNDTHPGITAAKIRSVLDNWSIRGDCIDSRGSRTQTHWGFVRGSDRMIRVAVSSDGDRVVAAYPDRTATTHWNRGSRSYFEQRCRDLEEQK